MEARGREIARKKQCALAWGGVPESRALEKIKFGK